MNPFRRFFVNLYLWYYVYILKEIYPFYSNIKRNQLHFHHRKWCYQNQKRSLVTPFQDVIIIAAPYAGIVTLSVV